MRTDFRSKILPWFSLTKSRKVIFIKRKKRYVTYRLTLGSLLKDILAEEKNKKVFKNRDFVQYGCVKNV